MNINKGPYGTFMTEKIGDNSSLSSYALELLQSGLNDSLLPVYADFNNTEEVTLSFDITELVTINEYTKNNFLTPQTVTERRNAIGSLFINLIKASNNLLFPEMIELLPEFIFTDKTCSNIKLIMRPFIPESYSTDIGALDSDKLETLLYNDFFKEVLSQDEITDILFLIQSGEAEKLKHTCELIKNSNLTEVEQKDNDKKTKIYLVLSAFLSFISLMLTPEKLSLLIGIVALILLLIWKKGNPSFTLIKKKALEENQASKSRSEILFCDGPKSDYDEIPVLIIESDEESDLDIKQAIYLEEAIIGSDRFLSDVYIPHDSVSATHCKLTYNNHSYYIVDISSDGTTYVEDRRLGPDKPFEIKNGQKLTVGKCTMTVRIGFQSNP